MRTLHCLICLSIPALAVAAACGSSESSDSAGRGPQITGNTHEQPPADDPNDLKSTFELGTGGNGGAGGAGAGGGSATGGTGGSGTSADAGPGSSLPPACVGWVASQGRVEPGDTDDTMSATRAREAINLGISPAPPQVRPRDFFNYYAIDLPASDSAGPLKIKLQLRARIVPDEYDLFVGVQAPDVTRPRSVLTVLVDTTPSMAGIPLARAKLALNALGAALSPNDSLVLLTTDATQGVLEPNLQDPAQALSKAAASLDTSSTGNIADAIHAAYASALVHLDQNAWNRVVFISDGAEPPELLPTDTLSEGFDKGIRLVGVGTGPTTAYRARLLEKATHYGHGAYVYVDNEAEAKHLFVKRFNQTFGVSFENVRIELGLPFFFHQVVDSTASAQTAGGDPATPQGLAPGASIAAVERLEVCDSTIFAKNPGTLITATVRWQDPTSGNEVSTSGTVAAIPPVTNTQPMAELDKALSIKAYVEALQSVDSQRVQAAIDTVSAAQSSMGATQDADLAEILELLQHHPAHKP
jgi:hypothetical protein